MTTIGKAATCVTATIGAVGVLLTLNWAYRKAVETAKAAKATEAAEAQTTFWNRKEICHAAIFRCIQHSFSQGGAVSTTLSTYSSRYYGDQVYNFQLSTAQTGITFSCWNVADGTFLMESDGKLFGNPKKVEYRIISLNEDSVQVVHRSLNKAMDEFVPSCTSTIPLSSDVKFNFESKFPPAKVEEWKNVCGDNWHVNISDLSDPTKTTAAEFLKLFDNRTDLVQLVKSIELIFDDATQLPAVLRQLTLHYAN